MQEHGLQTHDGHTYRKLNIDSRCQCAQTGSQIRPEMCACPLVIHYRLRNIGFWHPWDLTGQLFLKTCDPYRSDRFRTIATWLLLQKAGVRSIESTVSCCWLPCVPSEWKAQTITYVPDDPQATLWHCWTDSVRNATIFSLQVGYL